MVDSGFTIAKYFLIIAGNGFRAAKRGAGAAKLFGESYGSEVVQVVWFLVV
jgi:hypothetical protein